MIDLKFVKCPVCKDKGDIKILENKEDSIVFDCLNCSDIYYIQVCKSCNKITDIDIEFLDDDKVKATCNNCGFNERISL